MLKKVRKIKILDPSVKPDGVFILADFGFGVFVLFCSNQPTASDFHPALMNSSWSLNKYADLRAANKHHVQYLTPACDHFLWALFMNVAM